LETFSTLQGNKQKGKIHPSPQLIPAELTNKAITDRLLGSEYVNETQVRKKFLNGGFFGIVKKKH